MQENREKNSKSDEVGIEGLPVIRPNVAGDRSGERNPLGMCANVDRTGLEVETFGARRRN